MLMKPWRRPWGRLVCKGLRYSPTGNRDCSPFPFVMSVLILLSKCVTINGLYCSLGGQNLFPINQRQNKLIPTPEPDSGLHQSSRLWVLGLDNLNSCATPPAQPVSAVNNHISPGGMSTDEFPEQLETPWLPKEREHLVLTPGQAHEGFYRCWECWQKSWQKASNTQMCLSCVIRVESSPQPGNNRVSHLASLEPCHPWHLSSSHRAWGRAPSAGRETAVSKCKADILVTWKHGCNLSPPYFLHKKSVSCHSTHEVP